MSAGETNNAAAGVAESEINSFVANRFNQSRASGAKIKDDLLTKRVKPRADDDVMASFNNNGLLAVELTTTPLRSGGPFSDPVSTGTDEVFDHIFNKKRKGTIFSSSIEMPLLNSCCCETHIHRRRT
jgi:hypothetical protein